MLSLTERATAVIKSIVDQPDSPDTAGLRIAASGNGQALLSATAVAGPTVGDSVVENDGARVFLDAEAASRVDDQVLDVVVDDQDRMEFVLTDHGA